MSRLTRKEKIPNASSFLVTLEEHWKTKHRQQAIDKLGQLEDIEEELGIDLVTLFKAIKQGYIYRKIYLKEEDIDADRIEIVKEEFDLLNFEEGHKTDGVLHCSCLAKTEKIGNYTQYYKYMNYIDSYGEDWALTKEELE